MKHGLSTTLPGTQSAVARLQRQQAQAGRAKRSHSSQPIYPGPALARPSEPSLKLHHHRQMQALRLVLRLSQLNLARRKCSRAGRMYGSDFSIVN